MKHDTRYKQIGHKHRAESRYAMICNRVRYTERQKNSGYVGIKVLMTKVDFVEWFMTNDFEGCSVDRIDNTGNYSLENLQLISLSENIRKDKVKAIDGSCECYSCHEVKPVEVFARDKRRVSGHSTICRVCDNLRKRTGS